MMRSFLTVIFLLGSFLSFSQNSITAMEYYLDTDPGVGSGTSVSITSGTSINESFTIDQSLLTEGFHTLVIRVFDGTTWGVQESKTFYVSPSDPVSTATVDAAEYFLDTDPGVGAGTSFAVTSGTTIDADFTIPSASINEGFHTLVIRFQDSDGEWSVQEQKAFYASASIPNQIGNVTAAEYYLDTDPGIGAGTSITVTPGTTVDLNFTISNSLLTEGFHILVIRTQDVNGQWSVQESKALYVSSSDPIVTSEVTAAEYYLDTDPGIGLGNSISLTAGTTVDLNFTISNSLLTEGFHSLVVRTQDDLGQWGMQEAIAIYVSNTNPLGTTQITQIEYFFDTDPGIGSANIIDVVDAHLLNENSNFTASGLSAGMHVLYIRAQDEMGVWSMIEARNFLVDEFISAPLSSGPAANISAIEYFVGDDPGYGAGDMITITPAAATVDESWTVTTSGLAVGDYTFNARMITESGFVGQTETVDFAVCDGATANFSVGAACVGVAVDFTDLTTNSQVGDVYSWDFDGDATEDDTTVGDVSFTYAAAGTYDAELIITNGSCFTTATISVTVNDLPTVTATASATSICPGDEVTLTGGGASSYTWDNSVTDGVAFSPTATTTYTVTGLDANSCEATASVTVTVNTSPTVTANSTASAVCVGEQVTLSGGGADSYVWDNSVSDGVAFAPTATTTYTVTGTDANGCENTASVTVTVNDLPTIVANASETAICIGDEVTLTGAGGSTYVWDNSVVDGVAFAPTTTTTYNVTGTDVNGCENTDMVEVTVTSVAKPEITIDRDDFSEAVLTSSAASGNQWFEEGVLIAGATEQTLTVTDLVDFYTVQVTVNGCLSEMSDETFVYILDAQNQFGTLSIWPNPVKDQLIVDLGEIKSIEKIMVHDVAGTKVLEQHLNGTNDLIEIDVGRLDKGIYFLSLDGVRSSFRFIKN